MKKHLLILLAVFCAFFAVADPAFAQVAPAPLPPTAATEQASLESWKEAMSSTSGCWGCRLYENMARVTLEVGKEGERMFVDGAIAALNAFMGLWVVWQLFLLMSPSFAHNPSQTIDSIFQRIVVMMLVLFVLKVGPFNYIMVGYVFPTLDGVMATSASLIGGGQSCGGGSEPLVGAGSNLMCSMHVEMGKGIGLGMYLVTSAELSFWPGGKFEILQLIGGVIIALAFAMMLLILPFRLFDAMIRIAVVSIILPVCALAFTFKPTRGATKQAATSVLAAMLTFLFTAIAVAISVRLLNRVSAPVINSIQDSSTDSFIGPLDGSQFMVLIAAALGMATFIKQAGSLASEFSGFQGQMGNVGGSAAAMAGGMAATGAAGMGYGAVRGKAALAASHRKNLAPDGAGKAPAGPGQAESAPR